MERVAEEVLFEEDTMDDAHLESVGKLFSESESAMLADDLDRYMACFDDDAVVLWPDQAPIIGKTAIRD